MSLLIDRLLASLDDFHASDGIVQSGQWRFAFSYNLLEEMFAHGANGIRIGGIGLGVHDGGCIFYPVSITVAGSSLGSDYFNHESPGVSSVVVGCKTRAQVGKGVVLHLQGDHREVFLWNTSVVDCRLHAGGHFGRSRKVECTIGMVSEDLPNDSRIPPCDILRVVDVVENVN